MTPTSFSLSTSFVLGLMGVTFHRIHLISALLCLEGMMLSMFIALALWALQLEMTNLFMAPMLVLAFSACESSAGLSLLVATARTHGSDNTYSLNILQC
uniref:NADH-ubiquinone oxidoreductase chain 4L n=1 Tax=Betadevario ramachandrani TaxID=794813 RepID=A0A3P8MXH3_9TELE|nr:NADH dehydrogenase subunit 4L [Betadevario ramachandrani]